MEGNNFKGVARVCNNVSIRIEHSERSDAQDSAVGIRVVIPSLSLVTPQSGSYRIGASLPIQWLTHEVDGNVEVSLNRSATSAV